MSKRSFETAFSANKQAKNTSSRIEGLKKHTLDSDEEDDVEEDNVLDAEDIEGEEDGVARQEGDQKMTAFNMDEEMEEGHFDKHGHFIWNNEKEIRDNWLDNIDWQKIKKSSDTKSKYNIEDGRGLGDESDSETEPEDPFDELSCYKDILDYLKPGETVSKAIKRMGAADMKLSSVERLRRKKAGTLNTNEGVTRVTELANRILTKTGNMDVYQETYEAIKAKVESKGKKKEVAGGSELDMYSDDFDAKEKEKISSASGGGVEKKELMWEFKWKIEEEEVHGPYNTQQMIKWCREKYFTDGVMVRKCGENPNFYSLSRIDFELYE